MSIYKDQKFIATRIKDIDSLIQQLYDEKYQLQEVCSDLGHDMVLTWEDIDGLFPEDEGVAITGRIFREYECRYCDAKQGGYESL